jgi:2-amino-4-hydroxy-6-hydroxymethyldihydropteridine diphosphokinase
VDAIVGLGSNLGSREGLLRVATRLIDAHPAIAVTALSPPYVTPPLGPPQPDFLNAAVRVRTDLSPLALLAHLQQVEANLGRVREVRWGPRTLDLDVLWWFGGPIDEPTLTVPHPGLRERAFALTPLLDVAPELTTELGPRLAALPPATRSRWSEVRRTADRIEVDATDPLDALALGLDAALGEANCTSRIQTLERSSVDELLEALAGRGGPPGWLVLEPAPEGAIRARFTLDPHGRRARLRVQRRESTEPGLPLVLSML